MKPLVPLVLLAVASCGYDPAPSVDTASAAYRKDLTACEDKAEADVHAHDVKRALAWFASPVTRWGDIHNQTQACMAAKGYGGLRWCTADELRAHTGSGPIVTRTGLQCADPAGHS